MKKISLLTAFLLVSSFANAVPNYWTSDSNRGITKFNLVDGKNQAISCSSGAENFEIIGPSFSYIGDWKNSNKILIMDDKNTEARKIQVYSQNKLLVVFMPHKESIKTEENIL